MTTYWFIWDRIAAVALTAISWTVVKNGMAIKGYDEESQPSSGGNSPLRWE